jgi:hypothetical protein
MEFYRGTPARLRASEALRGRSPVAVDWNDHDPEREAALPESLGKPGSCSCESGEPCGTGTPPYPWTRQVDTIEINDDDVVSDDGMELMTLLEGRGIEDVIVMGVHTNICVLGRPYGIRQLVYWGKRALLCRDLTDSFHRDVRGHSWGTERTNEHIERYWCPSVTSDQLVGGEPFQFSNEAGSPSTAT